MNRPSEEQLASYFNNQLKTSEAKKVLDWLSTPEGQQYLSLRLDEDFATMDQGQKTILRPKITAEDILKTSHSLEQKPTMTKGKSQTGQWRVAAAAGTLALFMAVLVYFLMDWNNYETYQTAFAESADVILPDGSQVHMSGNSELKFKKDWASNEIREIWFEGEGYFDIVKMKAENRFTVHTARQFNVQVLGTTFTVTARPSTSRVVLESGAVALKMEDTAGQNEIKMVPGELVEIDHQQDLLIKKEVETAIYTSRKDDKLVFDKTPLKEIVRILKDDYGFTVIVNDAEILKEKLTGVVPSKDVEALLEGLRSLLDVKIIRDENVIKLIH
ncbi:FecR domain-containing protein [Echinicola sp. CAU 1574]|uniref:FecR domain-containing protein n=1 Tax=Echinicola arenosa TaxID=2774144 RepID=A0ABR9AF31_9BACT|nr:FecR domain-containing protein [Echinicola arenosa]MBD8487282.1 FecR domain-containing protein [Echinicola arenosa]